MKATWISCLNITAVAGALALAAHANGARAPSQVHAAVAPSSEFDRGAWEKSLTDADLGRREEAFARAVAAAPTDNDLRSALDEWTRGSNAELAWTSRLILRELGAPGTSGRSGTSGWILRTPRAPQFGGPGGPTWGDPDQLQRWMEEFERSFGAALGGQAWRASPNQGSSETSSSFSMEIGPSGVRAHVVEEQDGKRVENTYEAATVEELVEQHPELADRVQGSSNGPNLDLFGGRRLRFGFGGGLPQPQLDDDGALRLQGRTPQPHLGSRGDGPRTDVLGVRVRSDQSSAQGERGLAVVAVEPGTIAAAMGVQGGDLLVELNGTTLASREDVAKVLSERSPDGALELVLIDPSGARQTRRWTPPAPSGSPRDAAKTGVRNV